MFVGNFLPPSAGYNNMTTGKMGGDMKGRKAGLPQHLITAKTHKNMKICPCSDKLLK
jgi:hypothetical protein